MGKKGYVWESPYDDDLSNINFEADNCCPLCGLELDQSLFCPKHGFVGDGSVPILDGDIDFL